MRKFDVPLKSDTRQIGRRGTTAHAACVLEVLARKAGNVHPGRAFDDSGWRDFVVSAQAVCAVLDRAPQRGVGRTVLDGVIATRRVVGSNTNLGILLLLAPLCAVPDGMNLTAGVAQVLDDLTPEDARWVYEAIRMAGPGGIGAVDQADVVGAAPRCLREAMALAASRDTVACQYATSFQHVFEVASRLETLPPPLDQAIVTAHLEQMAHEPDTLIARKCGPLIAEEARGRAERVLATGWPDSFESREAFDAFDRWLREDGHRRNPGTSADLIAAGLYVALEQDSIQLPVPWLENLGEEEVVGIGIGE